MEIKVRSGSFGTFPPGGTVCYRPVWHLSIDGANLHTTKYYACAWVCLEYIFYGTHFKRMILFAISSVGTTYFQSGCRLRRNRSRLTKGPASNVDSVGVPCCMCMKVKMGKRIMKPTTLFCTEYCTICSVARPVSGCIRMTHFNAPRHGSGEILFRRRKPSSENFGCLYSKTIFFGRLFDVTQLLRCKLLTG